MAPRLIVVAMIVVVILAMTVVMQSKTPKPVVDDVIQVDLLDLKGSQQQTTPKPKSPDENKPTELLTPEKLEEWDDSAFDAFESENTKYSTPHNEKWSDPVELIGPWQAEAQIVAVTPAAPPTAPLTTEATIDQPAAPLPSTNTALVVENESPTDNLSTIEGRDVQTESALVATEVPETTPLKQDDATSAATWSSTVSNDFSMASQLDAEPISSVPYVPSPTTAAPNNSTEAPNNDSVALYQPVADVSLATDKTVEPSQPAKDIPSSVAQIAREHLRYGSSLARRGSLYSARQEFFAGLRLIADSLDLVNETATYRAHYASAILALNEASDFANAPGDQAATPLQDIVATHQSKVLSEKEIATMSPMSAMQAYFIFAEEHFSKACGRSLVASELLYSLGKLHTVKAAQDPTAQPTDLAIAILMHHAALNVDPKNYQSANELGVSLAKLRYYEPARTALLHSLATNPTAEAWLNLSVVHRALGETELAELALAEHKTKLAEQSGASERSPQIQWMENSEFAAARQVAYEAPEGGPGSSATSSANRIESNPASNKSMWSQIKKSFGAR
jgi:tetratricopeptide (TPR) repeat protein